jgi:dTDP-L-rhamnose 4-epimerase
MARNVYALTKRYQEELCLSLGAVYGIPVACLRLFNVYGPRQSLSNPYTGVLAIFLSRLLAGQRPVVYEDGGQTRDFVSVHDVVAAFLAALDSPAADGTVLNIGSGVPRPIGEVARTLARVADKASIAPDVSGQFRRGDVRHCTADLGLARRLLGFAPRVTWEDGLAELVEWACETDAVDGFAKAERELRERGLVTDRIGKA